MSDDPGIPTVGSHPARARALGRADRDDGHARRETAEIFDVLDGCLGKHGPDAT